jgi:putative SOS response-associated peptidase YedK
MCNLYSLTMGQQAIRELIWATRDGTGNLPSLPAIFPDYPAPVVSTAGDGARELVMMRWGMPGPANRCLVPATSSCEYEDTKPRKTRSWFPLDESQRIKSHRGGTGGTRN